MSASMQWGLDSESHKGHNAPEPRMHQGPDGHWYAGLSTGYEGWCLTADDPRAILAVIDRLRAEVVRATGIAQRCPHCGAVLDAQGRCSHSLAASVAACSRYTDEPDLPAVVAEIATGYRKAGWRPDAAEVRA